jgi:hypothetical protein
MVYQGEDADTRFCPHTDYFNEDKFLDIVLMNIAIGWNYVEVLDGDYTQTKKMLPLR